MLRSYFPRLPRLLAPFRRKWPWNNRRDQLPAEDPLTHSRNLLALARYQLERKNVSRARILIGFGDLLSGGDAPLEYLLDTGRLWMEFGHWPQAYDRFLEAELQAEESPLQEEIQLALLDLESTLAIRYAENKQSPYTGFWTCLVARRRGSRPDFPLNKAWQQLESSGNAQNRALEGVGIIGTAKFFGANMGRIDVVAGYLAQAPRSLVVLHDFRRFVQSLCQWKTLGPVTKPWLQVLNAVVQETRMDGRIW